MRTVLVKILKAAELSAIFFSLVVLSFCPLQSVRSTSSSVLKTFVITTSRGSTVQSFGTIQEAIDAAEIGSTIQVPAGVYYEHVIVNKTVSLIGEEGFASIIDGNNNGMVVEVTANNVLIEGFKVQNSGYGWDRNGIFVHDADNCTVRKNYLFNVCHNIKVGFSHNSQVVENVVCGTMTKPTMYGIRIENSTECTVSNNNISDCVGSIHLQNVSYCVVTRNYVFNDDQGIRLYSPCTFNNITENTVTNNNYDGMFSPMPTDPTLTDNYIFHNNFVNNKYSFIYGLAGNFWDNSYPSGGNYWSRYNGTDQYSGTNQNETGNDGIGDSPYALSTYDADRYPLMHPYGSVQNLNTSLTYLTIQSVVNAPETLDAHTITVRSGTYHEHIVLNKALSLIGECANTTIIDGGNIGTVVAVEADNITFTGFTVRNSGLNYPPYGNDCGILLDHCAGSNISNNQITENWIGLYLYYSTDNTIENNVVHGNHEDGIWLWCSGGNNLSGNRIYSNSYNFGVFGNSFTDFNNTVNQTNTVDGKPIQYVINAQNEVIDNQTDVGTLYLISCVNMTVRNLSFTRNGHGILCYNTTCSLVENVTTVENSYGIYLQDSEDNNVNNNHCTNDWVGICFQNSIRNAAENNTVSSSDKAFSLYEADNNTITGNTISDSPYGVRLYDSNNNIIHHNNLVSNAEQANLITCHGNSWDDGFEGNFWSNYNGSDAERDGIGDNPHTIDDDNVDHHPLFGMFHNFSASDNEQTCYVTVVTNSTVLSFTFEDSSNMITLTVDGSDETFGFCRIAIPRTLLEPEITVVIDAGSTETLYANYSLRDDGSYRWIYFAYQQTTHEITIIPESCLPLTLLALMFATFLCIVKNKQLSRDAY